MKYSDITNLECLAGSCWPISVVKSKNYPQTQSDPKQTKNPPKRVYKQTSKRLSRNRIC